LDLDVPAVRLLPQARRRAWEGELVRFQIDELNAVYDGLTQAPTPAERQVRLSRARLRIERILLGAGWIPHVVARAARAVIEGGLDEPEDAFGVALVLAAVGPKDRTEHAWIDRWIESIEIVSTDVRMFTIALSVTKVRARWRWEEPSDRAQQASG
jgi:hypothetical protein